MWLLVALGLIVLRRSRLWGSLWSRGCRGGRSRGIAVRLICIGGCLTIGLLLWISWGRSRGLLRIWSLTIPLLWIGLLLWIGRSGLLICRCLCRSHTAASNGVEYSAVPFATVDVCLHRHPLSGIDVVELAHGVAAELYRAEIGITSAVFLPGVIKDKLTFLEWLPAVLGLDLSHRCHRVNEGGCCQFK